ncbi:MAG TPA: GGDEF domain-containing protein [Candidatus Eisenbacteria bacterium]|jgi:diguanylate cyclase (GGDEF)-like protein
MTTRLDKAVDLLLELGDPSARRTRSELLDRTLRTAVGLMDADSVVILAPGGRRTERLALHAGSAAPATLQPPAEGSEVLRRFGESSQPLVLADLSDEASISAADGCPGVEAGPTLFTPMRQRNLGPAYLAAYRRRGRARFTLQDTRLMLLLGAWLSAALDNLRLATGTEKRAVTDVLTDVYNHRFLKTALQREVRRASRYGHELSLVIVDVDHLQAYQEQHGQPRVSQVLKELASLLTQQVRSFDVMGRNAGDGFMLILPQTGRDGAVEVGERMRAAVERTAFQSGAAGEITVSLGVASFPQDGSDANDLVAAADHALERARRNGSNRVESRADRKAA